MVGRIQSRIHWDIQHSTTRLCFFPSPSLLFSLLPSTIPPFLPFSLHPPKILFWKLEHFYSQTIWHCILRLTRTTKHPPLVEKWRPDRGIKLHQQAPQFQWQDYVLAMFPRWVMALCNHIRKFITTTHTILWVFFTKDNSCIIIMIHCIVKIFCGLNFHSHCQQANFSQVPFNCENYIPVKNSCYTCTVAICRPLYSPIIYLVWLVFQHAL